MSIQLLDFHPDTTTHEKEVLAGLKKPQKELPAKLFYDDYGSQLFEQITELEEYYPTRTELAIMQTSVGEMASLIGKQALLIEYGSGSSLKTETLLQHLPDLAAYIPIDISREPLLASAERIAARYPALQVLPVCADYTANFTLPQPDREVNKRVVFFPGSTIGNFHPAGTILFLRRMRHVARRTGGILIGVDTKKDRQILHAAYNDAQGVTAAFNLNILRRLNRDLGTDFALNQFFHDAFYDEVHGRVEMHLVSRKKQTVRLNGHPIHLDAGECIWTESSYKYTPAEFAHLAAQAGLRVARVWTDPDNLFSVHYLCST